VGIITIYQGVKNMIITDSQVHIWGADTPQRPWPKRAPPQRPIPLEKDELLQEMNAAGVNRAIIVPPSWEGDRNDLALEAASLHPDRFAIMGRLDTDLPESHGLMRTWREQPGMLGIRVLFTTDVLREPLLAGRMEWFWASAEQLNMPIMALFPFPLMHLAEDVISRYPNLRLIIDHMGMTGHAKGAAAFSGIENLLALARHPHVAVKVSALPIFAEDAYPFKSIHTYIRQVYDAFGPQRMFWGSDLSRLTCPYRQCVTLFTEELTWLSEADRVWIMGLAINEYLGWS
jgi:predicted TIM-barrel fold metal-dependent hydrolase